ncbi:MAG: helix-turn-helix domain-containing protein [Nanoarchaeota archaeon]|nr:helix-turn-helix domain-containing protein [Nanoarchaeota archaeon]MBU1322113.1 helix-turn-helix domain-containing protein [Nanoarchaeota archaeon]MBU1597434.1 helix-turn-helix domain-containing protein [Nanoarchaeota archaeon]MBU2441603.1 helix-turn-helix domain-containing protein [Nanoarchaeota archaeon]
MDIEFALNEYGLSDKEIKTYLALLPLGSINLQEIAKKVNLPRTTIYNTLNYLIAKGLVSFIVKGNARFYEAADPEKLVAKVDEKKALITSILPNLKIMKETKIQSSSVEIFEGTKGLFTILSDVFKIKQQIYYFGSYSLSKELLKHQPEHFRTIRLDKKIPAQIVMDKYDEATFHKKEYKQITEMRFNNALRNFPCMIFIYGKKVAIYTLKKDIIGIIISNEQVTEAMKFIFDMYWTQGKPTKGGS